VNTSIDPVAPSPDVLEEVAGKVSSAYPDLFPHQRAGVAFLLSRRRAILADDMGLGKTRQAIVAMREAQPTGALLVVCPAVVKLAWRQEILRVDPGADILVVDKAADWAAGHRWTVLTYEQLGRLKADVFAGTWAGVVVDEAHYIKNDSQRSDNVLNLIGVDGRKKTRSKPAVEPETVYLLTGTPMASRPRDLFNLLKGVRHPLGNSFFSFAKRYCNGVQTEYGLNADGASNLPELATIAATIMLRRTKDDSLDLPPKVRSWQDIEIASTSVANAERRALDFLAANPGRDGKTWGAFLGLLGKARHDLAKAKVPVTIQAVQERLENGEKVIVFTSYNEVVERILAAFPGLAVKITGDDSAEQRAAAADALQTDPNTRVLVGNLRAAGVGITLTAATHVIFNDLDWVPGNHWQAEDRIYRIGQTRPAFVTYLVAVGTLDDYVAAVLEQKARNIGVLEEEAAAAASSLQAVVDAVAGGERPRRTEPAQAEPRKTAGLLEETLELIARARRGVPTETSDTRKIFEIASKSDPGKTYRVEVIDGIPGCSCPGFSYRGNCSHIREVAKRLAS
jgi:SWI/SNF-related matrix-associated actin-dependent regulator 1 of chromatin subfamily A